MKALLVGLLFIGFVSLTQAAGTEQFESMSVFGTQADASQQDRSVIDALPRSKS